MSTQSHKEKMTRWLGEQEVSFLHDHLILKEFGRLLLKSFKHHLRRVAKDTLFTFEEFNTLIIEIKTILNSRPLTPLSPDPDDLSSLTPSHFLIGGPASSIPERDFTNIPINRISAWQHIQKVKRDFWNRWNKEYLNELTQRTKWKTKTHNLKLGT